ncbi:hypothetical protein ACFO5K_02395 [Nocardia halotolerans]|uniref:Uncharacterized protein n=1 Tax=Nocardia halotolerans TaxID=1755878 RepID=A0ABV8VAK8_9NOCA
MEPDERGKAVPSDPAEGGGSAGKVTVGLVQELLGATDGCLVLEAGRVRVAAGAESQQGGMVIISKAELAQRLGSDPDPTALSEQAAVLNTEVGLLGA